MLYIIKNKITKEVLGVVSKELLPFFADEKTYEVRAMSKEARSIFYKAYTETETI